MASIKAVLRRNKQRKDGTIPVAIRITKDRKTRFIFTGQYVLEKDWNDDSQVNMIRKSHPNAKRLNNLVRTKISEANDSILQADTTDENISVEQIKNRVKRTKSNADFFDVANERIKAYRAKGTFSVAQAEESICNNLRRFIKKEELSFQEITVSFIERFKTFCSSERNQKTRTITNQLIFIRTIFNLALSEGLVDQKYYPFAGEKVKIRIKPGLKIGLTQEEIEAILSLDLDPGTPIWHTRNVWLFSFYFAGVRISDVLKLKWSDFKDGRLYYIMNKNEKPVSLKVPERAQIILDAYKNDRGFKDDYIFPDLKLANQEDQRDVFVKSRNATSRFNKYLKRIAEKAGIEKNLSNHISRHSFGNIAGDKINPLMLQKLYRHSSLKTTIGYQGNFIHKEADDALDQVVGF